MPLTSTALFIQMRRALRSLTTQAEIQDFLDNGVSVKIEAGSTEAPVITINVADDAIYEKSEDLVLDISNPSNAAIGPNGSATGTIFDEDQVDNDVDNPNNPDDPADPVDGDKPVVGIIATKPQAVEGEAGNNALEFTVSQNNQSNFDTTVDVKLNSGASDIDAADIDSIVYTDATGTEITLTTQAEIQDFLDNGVSVKIEAGSTEAPVITINVADDAIYEKSEDLVLDISNPSNAAIGPNGSATGTIFDEDQVDNDVDNPNNPDDP